MPILSDVGRGLLNPGESAEPLDLRGWVVLSKQLKAGDEIIIDWPANHNPRLFDRPVRARVDAVSSLNRLGIDLQTPGAKDAYGTEWPVGPQDFWLDVMWHTLKVTRSS